MDLTFNGVTETGRTYPAATLDACSTTPAGYFRNLNGGLLLDVMQARIDGVWSGSVSIPVALGTGVGVTCNFLAGIFVTKSSVWTNPRPNFAWTGVAPSPVSTSCSATQRGTFTTITVFEDGNVTIP